MFSAKSWQRTKAHYENVAFQFILVELELALTFAKMAASTGDPGRKARNLNYTRQAYSAAMRFLHGLPMNPPIEQERQGRIQELKRALDALPGLRVVTFRQSELH